MGEEIGEYFDYGWKVFSRIIFCFWEKKYKNIFGCQLFLKHIFENYFEDILFFYHNIF